MYLKYFVEEKYIRALHSAVNAPVYEDSCVEFFIAFDGNESYYNFEFNCIGTPLVSYGKGKEGREFLPEDVIKEIKCQSYIIREHTAKNIQWQLTLAIPFRVFMYDDLHSLQQKNCKANFYKCGDLLPEPHFLSWLPIENKEPNFHLPRFFGSLVFE